MSNYGRAPYNFVPLSKAVEASFPPPPSGDCYHPDRLSGEIVLKIKAETNFYIRGMWKYQEYVKRTDRNQQTPEPFQVGSKLRLPGSSLRGMVRTLVEILGKAPLDPINDSQLFYRAVGASDNPTQDSFEPQAATYKKAMFKGSGRNIRDPLGPAAQAGYLHAERGGWYIRPAKIHPVHKTSWYRVNNAGRNEQLQRERIHFLPVAPQPKKYGSCNIYYEFGEVSEFRGGDDFVKPLNPGWEKGWLIRPGWMQKRHWDWIILLEDGSAAKIEISEPDRTAYLDSGATPKIKEKGLDYSVERDPKKEGRPCFYVQWTDHWGTPHVSFGHTPYFRLPYVTTPHVARDANKAARPAGNGWDLAQLLFGRTSDPANQRKGSRGRVFFEDAMLTAGPGVDSQISTSVLGQPKPTTYQHYLVQPSSYGKCSLHWDSGIAVLRGHKLYWHRPGASTDSPPDAKQDLKTTYRKALANNEFKAKVRFENLSDMELGILLTALDLPEDCRHKLGMGKPLGLGSFKITIDSIVQFRREDRYSSFFKSNKELNTGARDANDAKKLIMQCKKVFAEWYLNTQLDQAAFSESLWKDPRLSELKAILTWKQGNDWLNRTRYLGFGSIKYQNKDIDYNEYKHVPPYSGRNWVLAPRRPLPLASQILKGEINGTPVPNDSQPKWLTKDELGDLRAKARISREKHNTTEPGRRRPPVQNSPLPKTAELVRCIVLQAGTTKGGWKFQEVGGQERSGPIYTRSIPLLPPLKKEQEIELEIRKNTDGTWTFAVPTSTAPAPKQ